MNLLMLKVLRISLAILNGLIGSASLANMAVIQAPQNPSTGSNPRLSQDAASIPGADFEQARHFLAQGKYDEALLVLHDLEAKQPEMKGLPHELGAAYYRSGNFPNAIFYLKKARTQNPNDAEAQQLLGLSYYLAQRPAEAIPELEKVQTWFASANVDAAYILGICYIQTKDYPNARKAFAKMFDVPAESAASYLFTARMLLRQDFAPVAEEYAHKAVVLDPKLPLAHQLLGELYLYHSQIDDAIAEFRKELEINPADPAAYYKLADGYSRVQKYDEAERLLQRSIWLDPTSTGPYILLGKVLEKKGETELAVRALQRALAMDPNNPVPHHLLGLAYRDLGKNEEADRELKVAAQLEQGQNTKP
jgi:tetratricopeptide (TPR) repeat protein